MIKVVHLTSVHPRCDSRIFFKQCRALASAGFHVTLIVADGLEDEVRDGVRILGVQPVSGGRLSRMLRTVDRVFRKALSVDGDIYHLHDPELLTIALRLKAAGKSVIFDAHEDLPKQILAKHYLWLWVRRSISRAACRYERHICQRLSAVVAATPAIRDKFLQVNRRSIDVRNFPMLDEFAVPAGMRKWNGRSVCYVGSISATRGIRELVSTMDHLSGSARLALCGTFEDSRLAAEMRQHPGWRYVDELGWLSRFEVRDLLARANVGIVALHPTESYVEALPVKLFEYMSAGLPVIASDFPIWRDIVESEGCGICVNPLDPAEIASAIEFILADPRRAEVMGANGKRAIRERFNWAVEERKLIDLYMSLAPLDVDCISLNSARAL